MMKSDAAVSALAALAQESRLAIFRLLVQAGPEGLSAGRIGALTGIAPSSLSFHLKELTHARLASARQQGRFVFYAAGYQAMGELLSFLSDNCCGGNPCLPGVSQGVSTSDMPEVAAGLARHCRKPQPMKAR